MPAIKRKAAETSGDSVDKRVKTQDTSQATSNAMMNGIDFSSPPPEWQNVPPGSSAGLDKSKPPLSDFPQIFEAIARRALDLGLQRVLTELKNTPIRVATMCSGTDAPIIALRSIENALKDMGKDTLKIRHVFSAEIEDYKAQFIQRTAAPPVIFRNIEDFDGNATPPTVFGPCKPIPQGVHILIAGFACVDFSNLNSWTKSLSGAAKQFTHAKTLGGGTKDGLQLFREYRRYLKDMDQWFPGESGGTLFAIVDYADDHRPAIVILENVIGAPWKTIQALFAKIGYEAHWIKVDTKDFYIPATRQRCYLLAINNGKSQAGMNHPYFDIRRKIVLSRPKPPNTRDEDEVTDGFSKISLTGSQIWSSLIQDDGDDGSSTPRQRNAEDDDVSTTPRQRGAGDDDDNSTPRPEVDDPEDSGEESDETARPDEENSQEPENPSESDGYDSDGSDDGNAADSDREDNSDHDENNEPAAPPGKYTSNLSVWERLFRQFQRRASAPVDMFLFDSNELGYRRAIDALWRRNAAETAPTTPWYMSKLRHVTTRQNRAIGDETPVTRWDTQNPRVPNFMMKLWIDGQSERVRDLLDILYLAEAKAGRDLFQKSYVIDVSQNVDRKTSLGQLGMSGCITPAGIHYHTMLGRLLSGTESLALQGITKDMVHVTTESLTELQSLAGNAMTSTVVVSAILSAFMCLPDDFWKPYASDKSYEGPAIDERHQSDSRYLTRIPTPNTLQVLPSDEEMIRFLLPAEATRRLCYCEDHYGEGHREKFMCKDCRATVCKQCKADPEHNFSPLPSMPLIEGIPGGVFTLHHFYEVMQRLLPRALKVVVTAEMLLNAQTALEQKLEVDTIGLQQAEILKQFALICSSPAFEQDKVIPFSGFIRSTCWTLCWSAHRLRVHLVLEYLRPRWELFLEAKEDQGLDSEQRRLLAGPIATRLIAKDGGSSRWNFNLRVSGQFRIMIRSLNNPAKALKAQLCIPGCEADSVPSTLLIQLKRRTKEQMEASGLPDISGHWILRPNCGTSHRTLYAKETTEEGKPLFLFRESQPLQPSETDRYVIARECQRLDLRARRDIILDLGNSIKSADRAKLWRPNGQETSVEVAVSIPNVLAAHSSTEEILEPAALQGDLSVYTMGSGASLEPAVIKEDCRMSAVSIAQARFPYTGRMPVDCSRGVSKVYKDENAKRVFSLFPDIALQINSSARLPTNLTHNSTRSSVNCEHSCHLCTPPRPRIKWAQKILKKGAGIAEKLTDEILPAEDPASCIRFERGLRERPAILTTYFQEKDNVIEIEVTANVRALVHRALGKLHNQARSPQSASRARFNFDMNFVDMPNSVLSRVFTIPDNAADVATAHVFDQVDNAHAPLRLRIEQQRALSWMLNIENTTKLNFVQEQVAEAISPGLNTAVRAYAEREHIVRGGLVADEVGFGKTLTSIALIQKQQQKSTCAVDKAEREHKQTRIHLKATLVLVPSTLLEQWADEIKGVWKNVSILKIPSLDALQKSKVSCFQDADVVLFSHALLTDNEYRDRAAELAGLCAWRNTPSPRIFSEFEQLLGLRIGEFIRQLRTRGKSGKRRLNLLGRFLRHQCGVWLKLEKENGLNPKSRRVVGGSKKGAFYTDNSGDVQGERNLLLTASDFQQRSEDGTLDSFFTENERAIQQIYDRHDSAVIADLKANIAIRNLRRVVGFDDITDWRDMSYPVLSMFHFARKQVDEYHYLDQEQLITVKHIPADATWLISGTPTISTFSDINLLAEMTGCPLDAEESFAKIKPTRRGFKFGEVLTPLEKYAQTTEPRTNEWQDLRMKYAQSWLDKFARQNELDPESALTPLAEETAVVQIHWLHKSLYEEMEARMCGTKAYAGAPRGDSTIPNRRVDTLKVMDRRIRDGANPASALAWLSSVDPIASRNIAEERTDETREMKWRLMCELEFAHAHRFHNGTNTNGNYVDPKGLREFKEKFGQNRLAYDPDLHEDIRELLDRLDDPPVKVWSDEGYPLEAFTPGEYKRHIIGEQIKLRNEDAGILTNQAKREDTEDTDEEGGKGDKGDNKDKDLSVDPEKIWTRPFRLQALIDHYKHMYHGVRYSMSCSEVILGTKDCDTCHFKDVDRTSNTPVWVIAKCGHGICYACFSMLAVAGVATLLNDNNPYEGSNVPPNTPHGRCGAAIEFADEQGNPDGEPSRCGAFLAECELVDFNLEEPPVPKPVSSYYGQYHRQAGEDTNLLERIRTVSHTPPGGNKVAAIVNLIQDPAKIKSGARVLIFTQFDDLSKQIFFALRTANIQASCCLAPGRSGGAAQTAKNEKLIEAFKKLAPPVQSFTGQKNASKGHSAKVLILPLNSPIAAGHNLQMANHVILATPYLPETTAQNPLAQYKQAIGRAQRYGQKNKVTVHRFVNLRTVEVDIWETQLGKKLARKGKREEAQDWDKDWEFVAEEGIEKKTHWKNENWCSARPKTREFAVRLSKDEA